MKISDIRLYAAAVFAVAAGSFSVAADIPAGYYNSLSGKKEAELKTAVYERIHNFTINGSYDDVYYGLNRTFRQTDTRPGTNQWWDMYANLPLANTQFSGYLEREHSFPKSWWGGSTTIPAYVDINHLYPAERAANRAKSNYPLGEVDPANKPVFDNGVSKVGYGARGQGGSARYVFEPDDEYKGDFARTYFYMATCYQNLHWAYTYMVSNNTYPTLNTWSIDLLLRWHRNDPVSEKEDLRNEAVYRIQNNRNPFIDHPELAEYIWGDKKGQAFKPGGDEPIGNPVLDSPVHGMTLDFGQVALGSSAVARLYIKGESLRGNLDLLLYSGDRTMFSIPVTSLSAANANSKDGYWLQVTYKPTALGAHSSKIVISQGGITGSVSVGLRAECLPVPVLSAPTATAPTDIRSDSYTANWIVPASEVVDYYVITRTIYSGTDVREEKIEAEAPGFEITGFADSDREAYCVESVRLGVHSPKSNVVFVAHSGVTGVEVDEPLVVQGLPGSLRFICNAPQSGLRIYDMQGRIVLTLDCVDNNDTVELPAGIYLIVTDRHSSPVKAVVM